MYPVCAILSQHLRADHLLRYPIQSAGVEVWLLQWRPLQESQDVGVPDKYHRAVASLRKQLLLPLRAELPVADVQLHASHDRNLSSDDRMRPLRLFLQACRQAYDSGGAT